MVWSHAHLLGSAFAGVFMLIFLGESILAILKPNVPTATVDRIIHLLTLAFSFVIIFMIKILYFKAQPISGVDHALRHGRLRSRLFLLSHIPLGGFLIGLGAGLKGVIEHSSDQADLSIYFRLLANSLIGTVVMLNVQRLVHPYHEKVNIDRKLTCQTLSSSRCSGPGHFVF
jgi:low temperature requirement protein LtrA